MPRRRLSKTGREQGTVLFMFPAAMLIVVVLGAIAIDISLSQVRGTELDAVAASAADDALASLDVEALRRGDGIVFDHARAVAIVRSSVRAGPLPDANVAAVAVDVDSAGRHRITVTLRLRVEFVIAPALPGNLESTTITRTRSVTVLGL